ncbi:putative dinucleotide-binding enzyme [Devosia sp. UYZn731]|uniref:NADPH-dependent F420 reductase n=1 Tax=Devosia sp. UYZn731 TaxID=3156345 RepID=UPI00339131D6
MRFGVMGTGQVGSTIAGKLAALGHDVMLGSREPGGKNANKLGLKVGTHAEAARHGEWIVDAMPGEHAIESLRGCDIDGKILIDIGNYESAVDQPIITPLGEAIQAAFPKVRLVKTLNSVSAHLMVHPASLGAAHSVFIASNDEAAKADVTELLRAFGWQNILDLGDLTACRAMEQLVPMWMRLEKLYGGPDFNLAVARPPT